MMFLKVFKAWARFDPCTTPMKFTMAFENYKYEIDINLSLEFDGRNHLDLLLNIFSYSKNFLVKCKCMNVFLLF